MYISDILGPQMVNVAPIEYIVRNFPALLFLNESPPPCPLHKTTRKDLPFLLGSNLLQSAFIDCPARYALHLLVFKRISLNMARCLSEPVFSYGFVLSD